MYGRYHLTDPSGFYTQENAWEISADPNRAGVAGNGTAPGAVDANGNPIIAFKSQGTRRAWCGA